MPRNVIMLETKKGSPNGIKVETYKKGEAYTLPDSLYGVFKREGWIKDSNGVKIDPIEPEEKKIESAPVNKAVETPKNKNKDKEDKE